MDFRQLDANTFSIDGRAIKTVAPIYQHILLKDRVVVLFDPDFWESEDPEAPRNVTCYAQNGSVLWHIEDSESRYRRVTPMQYDRYGSIYMDESGTKLMAQDSRHAYVVDPDTGRLLSAKSLDW